MNNKNKIIILLLIIFSYLTYAFTIDDYNFLNDRLSDNPSMIHLSFGSDAYSKIIVTWITEGDDNPNQLRLGLTPDYEIGTFTGYQVPNAFSGHIHWVELEGLAPGTTYHYSVSPDTGGQWSDDRTFKTPSVDEIVFLVAGDSRQALPYPFGNLNDFSLVVQAMMNYENAQFLLFTGDMVFDGITEPYWFDWFNVAEPLISKIPLLPCVGNHETSGDDEANHYQRMFVLPDEAGTERYYAVDYGILKIISLDTEMTSDQAQIQFLTNQLISANENNQWIVVNFHKPPYTSGWGFGFHGPSGSVQNYWVPLFDQYGVDLVFNGHNHFYQRTFPLYGGDDPSNPEIVDDNLYEYYDPEGTIYVVSGAAGAPMIGYNPDNATGYFASYLGYTLEFCLIDITEYQLHYQAFNVNGDLIDEFYIYKGVTTPTPTQTIVPTETPTQEPTFTPTPLPTSPYTQTPTPHTTNTPEITPTLTPLPPTFTPTFPTYTPTIEPTFTPLPPSPTPIPSPTYTPIIPTFTPIFTLTPTPQSISPEIKIEMNKTTFYPGDEFIFNISLSNDGPEIIVDLYIILDVYQNYWFWPSWKQDIDKQTRILPPNYHQTQNILNFTWPYGAGSLEGIKFWAALTETGTYSIYSYDVVTWSFYE